jgi:hypothetical protein
VSLTRNQRFETSVTLSPHRSISIVSRTRSFALGHGVRGQAAG